MIEKFTKLLQPQNTRLPNFLTLEGIIISCKELPYTLNLWLLLILALKRLQRYNMSPEN